MQRILLVVMTFALAVAIGCNQNRASNKGNPSTGSRGDTSGTSADNNSVAGAGSSASDAPGSAKLGDNEKQLLQKIANADKAEIELGQLAQTNASSPKVKQFGQKLVDDHTQNQQQLQQIAQQKGIQLQAEEKPDEQSEKAKLEKTKGAQFDKAFLQHERDDHAKLLKDLQQMQDQVQDPDVKSFISQTITAVQDHLQEAQGSKATSTSPSGQ